MQTTAAGQPGLNGESRIRRNSLNNLDEAFGRARELSLELAHLRREDLDSEAGLSGSSFCLLILHIFSHIFGQAINGDCFEDCRAN